MPGSADETGAATYRPLLFSIAYGMTGSVGDAEDIVQDAFLGVPHRTGHPVGDGKQQRPERGRAPVIGRHSLIDLIGRHRLIR